MSSGDPRWCEPMLARGKTTLRSWPAHTRYVPTTDATPPHKATPPGVFQHAEEILMAVECGVDVFETSYAYKATEKGCAVVFPMGHSSGGGRGSADTEHAQSQQFEMNLKEERWELGGLKVPIKSRVLVHCHRYAVDFDPFIPGCPCYSCRHHTRAYTHHLIATNEILAKILIMMCVGL